MTARMSEERRDERFALAAALGILVVTCAWWMLALWPVADEAPYWLLRTRLVCFGAEGNGLPDAAGWVGLMGQPVGMFGALWFGWGAPLRSGLRRLRDHPRGRLAVHAVMATVLVGVLGAGHRVGATTTRAWRAGDAAMVPATYPRLDRAAPPLALVDQHGNPFTLDRAHGRSVLITFAYAHCETVCPLLVRNALDAQARLADAGVAASVVVVTLDPWRDTPSRLPHIATSWGMGANAWMLGGAPAEVEAALDAWEVPRMRDERTGEVSHPALTYVIGPDGVLAYATTGSTDALVELVRRL